MIETLIIIPWVNESQRDSFLYEWKIDRRDSRIILQQDKHYEGCAITKNIGISEALRRGAETIIILDDDCYPCPEEGICDLEDLIEQHLAALKPVDIELFSPITDPPSRGTPYNVLTVKMPVAASMGFWNDIGDYCAVRQLAIARQSMMKHFHKAIYGRYFPLCGMNLAFRPSDWYPWCKFIEVPRFDDIWMGWLWQREAYRKGYCFNLAGPTIRHSRQSNVWKNLQEEAMYLEENETLWAKIATHPESDYQSLRNLLPV